MLPENYPGIYFNHENVCSFCLDYQNIGRTQGLKEKPKLNLERIFAENKNKADYDCLVCFSGGKDSTYLLYLLTKVYRLRVLAYTCDTGFLSEVAHNNIKNTVEKLNVEHIFLSPPSSIYKKIYSYILSRPNQGCQGIICGICFSILRDTATRLATVMHIPFIALGFVGSGLFPNNSPLGGILRNDIFHNIYSHAFNEEEKRYILGLYRYQLPMSKMIPTSLTPFLIKILKRCPHKLSRFVTKRYPRILLALEESEYNEEKISKEVVSLGLIKPGNEGPEVTNCLLNYLMIYIDTKNLGYNPYVASFSNLVRTGMAKREMWIAVFEKWLEEVKKDTYANEEIGLVLEKLNLTKEDLYFSKNRK
ncbi:MAG: hypothetical protein A2166_03155 [Omnitrophica WOR_2 bacterium RBG_13_41_10]|nr:MAG: hypothetical protein A2166_03155 [Omnitrophica WOR_2 bacterium RBG_13_41_10]